MRKNAQNLLLRIENRARKGFHYCARRKLKLAVEKGKLNRIDFTQ